jgi:subfamily B ATP-binding cassette protein MsbA
MRLKVRFLIYNLLRTTSFWRDNYLILREFKHFPWVAISAVMFSLLAAVFEGITIGLLTQFLRTFTNPDALPIQTGIDWFDVWFLGINASASGRLYRVSALIFVTVWLRSSFVYLGNFHTRLSELNLADRLRKRLFEQFQGLSLSYFSQKRSGELINSIISEVYHIRLACGVAAVFIAKGFTLLVYLISMLWLSWQLTIVSMLMFMLLATGLSTLRKQVREASFEGVKASGNFISVSMEFIGGIRTVQAFATQDFERRRFYKAADQLLSAHTKSTAASSLVQPVSEGVSTTILLIMLIVAITIFVANRNLEIASLLTFLFVLLRMAPVVTQLNGSWSQISSFQGSLKNVKELLRTDDKTYLQNGKLQFSGLKRAIEFVSVDFGYDASNQVLHNITLTIKRGQMTALVGASGAGKTTLADLIPRFYDPTQGKIFIDGVDLREFEINSMRRKMAVVSQDTFIFNTSVWNNIAYGTEDADAAAIREAARNANALEFILEMPEGFETKLGDRGVRLSGGQRQRIAIARALLRDPDILILDEATSALDSVSERLIQESLEKLSFGRTVIAIAHRLSTIVRADKVVVLEQGRIVERGGYQELLEQRGKLWKYHQMQHELGKAG